MICFPLIPLLSSLFPSLLLFPSSIPPSLYRQCHRRSITTPYGPGKRWKGGLLCVCVCVYDRRRGEVEQRERRGLKRGFIISSSFRLFPSPLPFFPPSLCLSTLLHTLLSSSRLIPRSFSLLSFFLSPSRLPPTSHRRRIDQYTYWWNEIEPKGPVGAEKDALGRLDQFIREV